MTAPGAVPETTKQARPGRLGDEGEARADVALTYWEKHWAEMMPPSGKGRFVYQHHWRGLSEDEAQAVARGSLTDERLMRMTTHSVHGDLRFQTDVSRLHGFTIFLGTTAANLEAGGDRLIALPEGDNLQVAPKLPQPIDWLEVGKGEPYLAEPGGVGSTSASWSAFFLIDSGEYRLGVARKHMVEYFLEGERLKGRLIMMYAPLAPGGTRAWIVDRPRDQLKPRAGCLHGGLRRCRSSRTGFRPGASGST